MPLYDFQCTCCLKEFEELSKIDDRLRMKCPECGSKTKILLGNVDKRDWFRPHVTEHFDDVPTLVRSKGHLKELCLKHNVTSRALGDVRNCHQMNQGERDG